MKYKVKEIFFYAVDKDNSKEDVSTYLRYSYFWLGFGCLFSAAQLVECLMFCASAAISKREEARLYIYDFLRFVDHFRLDGAKFLCR